MSFPKFFVTYSVMDMDAGANPFGHSFLIFSKQDAEDSPIEVIDSIGFYSQPSTTTDPIIKTLKGILGFNIDLQDGHGILVKETMRSLNGNGLRGISFQLSEKQFLSLQTNYQESMKKEQEAITELNAELTARGVPANGYTRYLAEKEKAQLEQRKPRLRPFHVTMQMTMQGFDSSASYTCKDRALDFLYDEGIINEALRKQIIAGKAGHAFPRFHDLALPPLRLISTGEPEEHRSKRGHLFHNPVWQKNQLFWATLILKQDKNADAEEDYYDLKFILNRIAQMENALYQILDKPSGFAPNELHQLRIQLKRVHNLAFLFNKAHLNQGKKLQEHLATAEKVLNVAALAMEPERINSTFFMRAYTSIAMQSALLGLLAILLSSTLLFIAPPVGITLCTLSTLETVRSLHRFYQEETKFTKTKKDYNESLDDLSNPSLVPA
ncbi:hypothetical protein [Legionella sp. km772]|uniref:hypothetical protein n=1 Tax=Legionella sp. km772 TaxID=2498111 RepID=UPI000F8CA167|nr:hypothetical protein [Legionella sp. km772]RUR10671.1 hypothetical protein ELY15_07900 [Legionella sp. km772]